MTQQPDDDAILRRALSEAYVQIDGLRARLRELTTEPAPEEPTDA